MIGIQRLCGVKKTETQSHSIKVIKQNESSRSPPVSSESFYTNLKTNIWKIYAFARYKINQSIRKFCSKSVLFYVFLIKTINSNFQRNLTR